MYMDIKWLVLISLSQDTYFIELNINRLCRCCKALSNEFLWNWINLEMDRTKIDSMSLHCFLHKLPLCDMMLTQSGGQLTHPRCWCHFCNVHIIHTVHLFFLHGPLVFIPYHFSTICIGYFYVITLKHIVHCWFLFSGIFRTSFTTKLAPKTFDDVIFSRGIIYM